MLPEMAFWTASGARAWVYAGCPVAAASLARVRPVLLRAMTAPPTITVAIAVHDEAAHVGARIADALAQVGSGAPVVEVLVGSDGSTDAPISARQIKCTA